MKWLALAIVACGAIMLTSAYEMNGTSGFEDGSLMIQMSKIIAGGAMVGGGAIALIVLMFIGE